jgi:hypothetical protein
MVEPEQGRLWRSHNERSERDRENRNGQEEAHQFRRSIVLTRPPRAERDRASVKRWGRPVMTASRSVSLIVAQAVISAAVRPQPMHKPDSGSITQTLMQGVETASTLLT